MIALLIDLYLIICLIVSIIEYKYREGEVKNDSVSNCFLFNNRCYDICHY